MDALKGMAYDAVDALTLGRGVARKISGESIRFPARWSRYYPANYEPETFAFFRGHVGPGDTVMDIGAHIGLFAVVAARLAGPSGKVFAFEPTPFTRSVLEKVVELNDCSDIVEARHEAVSSTTGETTFFDTGNEISNANSLVRSDLSRGEIAIRTVTVDEFVNERKLRPKCIKIDVEGAELDVLSGAADTIRVHRPAIRLGLHPRFIAHNGQSLDEIWRVVVEYELEVIYGSEKLEKDQFVSQTELFDVDLIPKN